MDAVEEDIKLAGVGEDDAEQSRWRQIICCGDPWREQEKEQKKKVSLDPMRETTKKKRIAG